MEVSRPSGISPRSTPGRTTLRRRNQSDSAPDAFSAHRPPVLPLHAESPAPDVLEALITRARNALQRGILWERGSILDLLL